jgi:hypothetical protein
MKMINYKVFIKPDETIEDIIAELCDEGNTEGDEPFVFSGIITPTDETGCDQLKINCIVPIEQNPFSVRQFVTELYKKTCRNRVRYVQPTLEKWLECFQPLLLSMVSRVYPMYVKLLRERDDMLSILYLTVVQLYNKGYYLHKTLIYKCFINNLNMECRKIKAFQNCTVSLDEPEMCRENDNIFTLGEQIADTRNAIEEQEDAQERDTLFEYVKQLMLKDMSEFAFNRILIQLKSKTLDKNTIYQLKKYREMLNG